MLKFSDKFYSIKYYITNVLINKQTNKTTTVTVMVIIEFNFINIECPKAQVVLQVFRKQYICL